MKIVSLILLFIIIVTDLEAEIVRVPADQPTIQSAIDNSTNGDTVLVSPGTYYENLYFNGKNIIVSSLELTTNDSSYISTTIIDGNYQGRVVTFWDTTNTGIEYTALEYLNDGNYQRRILTFRNQKVSNTKLNGFTITHGQSVEGGGILIYNANPQLTNLRIINNRTIPEPFYSPGVGGGIYASTSANLYLNKCIIKNNWAGEAGGIYGSFINSVFIDSCQIVNNGTNGNAGGLNILSDNCVIKNSVIANNSAYYNYGLITRGNFSLINCSIYNNSIACWSEYTKINFINSIIWKGNIDPYYNHNANAYIVFCHSDVSGSYNYPAVLWLDGNMDTDPRFKDPSNNDLQLTDSSFCIDVGVQDTFFVYNNGLDTLYIPPIAFKGSNPDMGAYESNVNRMISVHPGDTDNNGIVDEYDILPIGIYFNERGNIRNNTSINWGPKQVFKWTELPITFADCNGDGSINENDISAIVENWENQHTDTLNSFSIDLSDSILINNNMDNFVNIYNHLNGDENSIQSMKILLETIIKIDIPNVFYLSQNYPNPFNITTTIPFGLDKEQKISLRIFNVLGQIIDCPIDNQTYKDGNHKIYFDAQEFSSGNYYYILYTESWRSTRKMVILK